MDSASVTMTFPAPQPQPPSSKQVVSGDITWQLTSTSLLIKLRSNTLSTICTFKKLGQGRILQPNGDHARMLRDGKLTWLDLYLFRRRP